MFAGAETKLYIKQGLLKIFALQPSFNLDKNRITQNNNWSLQFKEIWNIYINCHKMERRGNKTLYIKLKQEKELGILQNIAYCIF